MTGKTSRREALKLVGLGAGVSLLGSGSTKAHTAKKQAAFPLGLASYSLRKFNLEDTLAMTQRVQLPKVCFKSMHLPLHSSKEQIDEVLAKVRHAGLDLYGAGVVYMKKEQAVHQAFDYASHAGMKVIVGVPGHNLLPLVERKVKETNIKVAIHNHGPGDKLYPTPASIVEKVKDLDRRIGMCMDIGHTLRIGEDPITDARRFADRLHDVHIKDITQAAPDGHELEIGRGVINIPGFLRTLIDIDYKGVVSFEYEKDANDPLPGLAESVGYVNGVLATI